eukprot:5607694-Pyramimonas_sp.AAC.1
MMPKGAVIKSGGAAARLEKGPRKGSRFTGHGYAHRCRDARSIFTPSLHGGPRDHARRGRRQRARASTPRTLPESEKNIAH